MERTSTGLNPAVLTESAPVPHLQGLWLRVARLAWILLAMGVLFILLTSLGGYAQRIGRDMGHNIRADSTATIIISALSYLASLSAAIISLSLAVVFFRRRFAEPVVATVSFYLLLYSVVMAGPLEFWSADWLGDDMVALRLQGPLITILSVALLVLFPNGRFVPAWSRWLLVAAVPWSLASLFLPSLDPTALTTVESLLLILLAMGLTGMVIAGFFTQFYRYRHVSSPSERQQTKWVIYGFALWLGYIFLSSIPYFYLISLPAESPVPWWGPVSVLGWFLSLNIVPLSLAIAVTRYRLWDIDLVINRTLVYGLLTGIVIGMYVVLVGAMGALFQTQGNWVITLVATGLVAVLFQPIRQRVQRGINRLLYGERDEPFEVLSRFGRRLQDAIDPDLLLPTMAETIAQSLKLPYVAIAIKQGDTFELAESYGKPVATTVSIPLTYQGTDIGQLLVAPRASGETFTAEEVRLLQNVARQAGTAVHALQLTSDLQYARQQIISSREEERRRLRRDLHDGLGPSLAALMLKIGSARALLRQRPEVAEQLLKEMEGDIEGTLTEVRRIVYDLRPPALDQWGLAGALRAHAETYELRKGDDGVPALRIQVETPAGLPQLPAAVEVAAYHIGREGLTNVVRHARARHCVLRLVVNGDRRPYLTLSISDDGVGFDSDVAAGVGLTAMRERAAELGGSLQIDSTKGHGTIVTATLPIHSGRRSDGVRVT